MGSQPLVRQNVVDGDIKIDRKELVCEDGKWVNVTQDVWSRVWCLCCG
jgi:hypothetical protein